MGVQIDILSPAGVQAGSVDLPAHLFEAEVCDYALYRAVVSHEANRRQGNAAVKGRAQIKHSGKKHHRQKGTGMARRGSLRSPLMRGGGVAFGPQPRSYRQKTPRTLRRRAFASALSLKCGEGRIKVVDDFEWMEPSTRSFAGLLEACGLARQKVLFVTPGSVPVLVKSCRNIPGVQIRHVGALCAYDVLAADSVLFTRGGLARLAQVCAPEAGNKRSKGR